MSLANSADPDQRAPALWSGSTQFALDYWMNVHVHTMGLSWPQLEGSSKNKRQLELEAEQAKKERERLEEMRRREQNRILEVRCCHGN